MSNRFFIIGFMGSGKTYWGKQWAAQLGIPFYDLDEEIEKEFGLSVKEIFEKYGEEAFRKEEAAQLQSISLKGAFLLSTGGGAPCFYDNMSKMKAAGTVVYLKARPQYILQRVANEMGKRPLLSKLKEEERFSFIESKLQEREPFYSQAHVILNALEVNENSLNDY